MNTKVTSSIVLYKNDFTVLQNAVHSLFKEEGVDTLFLVDNSPTDELKILATNSRIEYIHNPANPGFGASHNVAIQKAMDSGSKYHFIVNPDISFEGEVVHTMVDYMRQNPEVGMMMPEVLNEDGSVQYLPKLLPDPLSIVVRRLKKPGFYYRNFIEKYELRFIAKDQIYNTPILSGCFTLLNMEAIKEIGMYDDIYFMYLEDWDLSRRMHKKYKTIYFPHASVYHGYAAESAKNTELFKIHIKSTITYFNRWGWFFDKERRRFNKETLRQFKSIT